MERTPGNTPAPAPDAGRAVAASARYAAVLTRDDLRFVMQQYADGPRTRREAAAHYAYPAGFVLSLVLGTYALTLGWSLGAAYGTGVVAIIGIATSRHERRWRRERLAFNCPECHENLVPGRAELAMATGRCPVCGHALFAP